MDSSDIISPSLISDSRKDMTASDERVLVVYSGGTIGSAPRDLLDPESPEIVYDWEELQESVSGLQKIPFPVDAISFREPLDSSNVGPRHWKAIAEVVEKFHDDYVGFVIAHGTDTMVYTASALSFILQDLDKPVVITGSQIPALYKVRNDAEQNLITALLIAQHKHLKLQCVPEVSIFFRDRLIRGNRSKKLNASGYAAFDSLNYPPLGTAGDVIAIDRNAVREPSTAGFKIQPELNTNVVMFDVFPGLQDNSDLYTALLGSDHIEGVVLRTYGAGNVPTKPVEFLEAISDAVRDGKIVINVTQCVAGDVKQGLYDTSAVLQDMGVISGQDITPEAALCKLMNVLGDGDLSSTARKARMSRSLAGEQNYSMYNTVIDSESQRIDTRKGEEGRYRSAAVVINGFSGTGRTIEKCLIRFVGASISGAGKVLIKIFLNLAAKAHPTETLSAFAGQYLKSHQEFEETFTFDIAQTARQELKPESTLTVYVEPCLEGQGELSWRRLELTLFLSE
jgi:L-asparaginase